MQHAGWACLLSYDKSPDHQQTGSHVGLLALLFGGCGWGEPGPVWEEGGDVASERRRGK